jgi:hypothetical protein
MKKIFALLLLISIFCGCENKSIEKVDKLYPVIDKIETPDGYSTKNIKVYVIDECEYIGSVYNAQNDILTHKGNCKFCAQRNLKKTQ